MKKRIFVISGPSGSGKTSVLRKLFSSKMVADNFFRVPTYTTRLPRRGEKEGKDYRFLLRADFIRFKRNGYFFETKKYLDNFYATPANFLQQATRLNKYPILCIDVEGALKVKRKYKDSCALIFIAPPSDKILMTRLEKRRTESTDILKKRLRLAKKEVKYAEKYEYRLVNRNLKHTVDSLRCIFLQETGLKNYKRSNKN